MPSVRNVNFSSAKRYSNRSYLGTSGSSIDSCSTITRYPEPNSYRCSADSSRSSIACYSTSSTSSRWPTRYSPYAHSEAGYRCDRYSPGSQAKSSFRSTETTLDYYTRTAPYKYKRRIARHTGIVNSPHILEHTCAKALPGQGTCMHASTTAGDIVNYIPMGNPDDVPGDAPIPAKLSMHFMVLLPKYYKPIDLQSNPAYHAALVITKNPIGPSTLVAPQPGSETYKANNIPYFQTVVFDAHSKRRKLMLDDAVEKKWHWKANTSVGYHIKIVHVENLHAVIYPEHPTCGLKLSDGAFQQVLKDLGEEDDELEYAREARNVEFWGKADTSRGRRKSSHRDVDDWLAACKVRRDESKLKALASSDKQ